MIKIKDTNILYILHNANYFNKMRNRGTPTVCSIFWNALGGFIALFGIAYTIFSVLVTGASFIYNLDPDLFGLYLVIPAIIGVVIFCGVAIIVCGLGIILIAGGCGHLISKFFETQSLEKFNTFKENASILYQAHKEKWCPMIDVIETKKGK